MQRGPGCPIRCFFWEEVRSGEHRIINGVDIHSYYTTAVVIYVIIIIIVIIMAITTTMIIYIV